MYRNIMKFTPAPPNDFAEFIQTYFARCRERVPGIEANAGKWTFEDLIPGLSDFDTRFLVNDALSPRDWCQMSMEVGRVAGNRLNRSDKLNRLNEAGRRTLRFVLAGSI